MLDENNMDNNTNPMEWWKICETHELAEGGRVHVEIDGRYVTVFRNKGELCCIDAGIRKEFM